MRSEFFETAGLRLHVLDRGGQGPPLVFLHGGSAHARWWDFVAPKFTDAFHVYAPDLRGHGESDWAADGAYRIEDYAADLGRAIDALALERPALVGHSLGSFVALRYAIEGAPAVRALVLVDGRAAFGPSGSRYMKLLQMFVAAEYPTLDEAVRRFRVLPSDTSAAREVLDHVARESFRPTENGSWVAKFDRATLGGHEPFDLRSRLAELQCPVLVVRGEKSPVLSTRAAAELASACRRGRWAEIAGAYHHVLLDRPAALARVIREFLGSC